MNDHRTQNRQNRDKTDQKLRKNEDTSDARERKNRNEKTVENGLKKDRIYLL